MTVVPLHSVVSDAMVDFLTELAGGAVTYKPGWRIGVDYRPADWTGNTIVLVAEAAVTDSGGGGPIMVAHERPFLFPDGGPERVRHEVFQAILDIERHEAMEFFAVGHERPFYPDHRDPYRVPTSGSHATIPPTKGT